jgi:hypothetical protein
MAVAGVSNSHSWPRGLFFAADEANFTPRNDFVSNSHRFAFAAAALAAIAVVAQPSRLRAEGAKPEVEAIQAGLFEAMDAGQVDVKIIPQDATKANVLIKNLTDKPLELRLPNAFASIPVLAQGMMGGGMGGMGGGGMGGMGGGGMGGGMGMMRVAPERMRKLEVTTVCLEHGKPDPNPKMAYKMVPIEQFTADPKIRVLCEALGYGQVTQNTAQAAAWHIMDDLSWQELASKNRVESKYVGNIRWFSPIELQSAVAVVQECTRIAESRESSESQDSESSESAQTQVSTESEG